MVHFDVLYIFFSDGVAPKRRGAWNNLLPLSPLSTSLAVRHPLRSDFYGVIGKTNHEVIRCRLQSQYSYLSRYL